MSEAAFPAPARAAVAAALPPVPAAPVPAAPVPAAGEFPGARLARRECGCPASGRVTGSAEGWARGAGGVDGGVCGVAGGSGGGTTGVADVGGADGFGGTADGAAGADRAPGPTAGGTPGMPALPGLSFSSVTENSPLPCVWAAAGRPAVGPVSGSPLRNSIEDAGRPACRPGAVRCCGPPDTAGSGRRGEQLPLKACNLGVRQIDQTFRGLTNANGDHLRSEYKRGSRHGARPSKGKSYQAGSGY